MNTSIEDTIGRVEQLYTAITGQQPPHVNGNSQRIPPEIDPVRHVEEQLGRLVSAIDQRFVAGATATPAPTWVPSALAWSSENAFELAIDVPGVPREQLELRLWGQTLSVRGERRAPWGASSLCSFARTFALPEPIELGQVSARLEAGVLRVRITRRAAADIPAIPIQG